MATDKYVVARRLHVTEVLIVTLGSETLAVHQLMQGKGIDKPLPERTAQWYVAKARDRIEEAAAKNRHRCRAEALRRLRALYEAAAKDGEYGAAAAISTQINALNGTRSSAAEAEAPSLQERAEAAVAQFIDYEPTPRPDILPRFGEIEKRVKLRRLVLLADGAPSSSAAAYRQLGDLPQDETGRRLWIQKAQALAIQQGAIGAGVGPDKRREGIHRGAASYAMLTRDADVAQQLADMEEQEQLPEQGGR